MWASVRTVLASLKAATVVAWSRRRRWAPLLTAVVVTAAVATAVAGFLTARYYQRQGSDRNLATKELRSMVLGENRRLLVHLPDSYRREPSRRYPVLYVLDGGRQDVHTDVAARVLARSSSMPEILVVGVVNVSKDTRWRDYTPPYPTEDADAGEARPRRADLFLRFLETEVIPYIDERYRTDSTRMIAGHSLGGLFVLYSLFEKPALFQARFAYSPSVWISEGRLRAELERSLRAPPPPMFLYLSLGEHEKEMAETFQQITEILRRLAPPSFRWRSDITRGAHHVDNDDLSTPAALRAYYHQE